MTLTRKALPDRSTSHGRGKRFACVVFGAFCYTEKMKGRFKSIDEEVQTKKKQKTRKETFVIIDKTQLVTPWNGKFDVPLNFRGLLSAYTALSRALKCPKHLYFLTNHNEVKELCVFRELLRTSHLVELDDMMRSDMFILCVL